MGGFGELLLATLLFVGSHFLLANPPVRTLLVARLGEQLFALAYSIVAAILIGGMIYAFVRAPYEPLWNFGPGARHIAMTLMPFALLLLICSVSQSNPTAVGQSMPAAGQAAARGMLKVTRHPLMWAFALWAIAHLIANGEVAALILFGGMLFLALVGAVALDAKHRARDPEGFARLAAATSYIPFVAMIQGRARLTFADIGWWRIAVALIAFVALVALHPYFTGHAVI